MGSTANLLARISADASPFSRAIGEVNAALDAANRKAQATSGGFRAFGDQLSSIGNTLSVGMTLPVIALGAAVVNSAANMDSLKRGLIAVSGSAAEAERQFVGLKEVAKLPGLGLKEAVQGSINLQALGNSAEQSQRILKVFGNALATVGRGREDLAESIRQLGQLGARGQVTADNLKPLIERIPQLSTIIREKFGPEALGNPAETFKTLGINSKEFIEVILTELGKLPMVTGGAKNAIENFKDAVEQTSARIGEKLLPAVEALLPKLEKLAVAVADTVDFFTKLPAPIQNIVLALGGIAVVSGPTISAIGGMTKAFIALQAVLASANLVNFFTAAPAAARGAASAYYLVGGSAASAATSVGVFGAVLKSVGITVSVGTLGAIAAAFVGIGASVAGVLTPLLYTETALKNQENAADKAKAALAGYGRQLQEQANKGLPALDKATGSGYESLLTFTRGLRASKVASDALKPSVAAVATAVAELREKVVSSYEEDFKTAVLKERLSLFQADYTKRLNDGVIALSKYKDAAGAANAALTEMRITAEAPELKGAGFPSAKNLPRPTGMPGLPTRSSDDILNEAQNRAAGKRGVDIVRENTKDAVDVWKQAQAKMRQAVSTITTDFSRGIADIITNGGKVGELFEKLGKQIANTLIRTVIEGGINQVTKSLAGLLTSLGGVGAKVGVLFGGAANASGTIFNAAGSSAGSVASAAGSIGAAGASAASSASGSIGSAVAAANPVTAVVTAVAGVVTALSSVVANFQFAAMNKSLDLIEKEVRYSQIHLLYILEKMNQYLPKLADIHQRLVEIIVDGVKVRGGGEGINVNITVNGSMIGGPNVAAELSQMVVSNLKLQGIRA